MKTVKIELINDYYIEVDELNHTLKQRYMGKNKDGVEKECERIIGYFPDVRIYNKMDFVDVDKNGKPIRLKPMHILLQKYTMEQIKHFETVWKMQRWVNMRSIFMSVPKFEDYLVG